MEAAAPMGDSGKLERLTERQKDCLRLVGQGYTSKEIGPRLGISHVTVDNYVRGALDLLQVDSRAGAARLLLSHETDQPLIYQSPRLVTDGQGPPETITTEGSTGSAPHRFVPPLGGQRNTLPAPDKVYAIFKVAVIGLSGLFALTLGLAGLFWLLR
jgi:DNA-binding CsgD family transcriptional regulator